MKIKVYESDDSVYLLNEKFIEIIDRKIFNKGFLGNFVPHYCRYKKQTCSILGSIDYAYMHGYDNDAYIII